MGSVNRILLVAVLFFTALANLVNVEVKRVIDVKSTVAISRTGIHLKNQGTESVESFFVAVSEDDANRLGDIWAADASSGKPLRALRMESTSDIPNLPEDAKGFQIWFSKPLRQGGEVLIDLRMDVVDAVVPVPDVIEKHEAQYMRYEGNSYFFTPYETKLMATNITLGSSTLTSKDGLKEPFALSGSKFILGPYSDVKPFSTSEFSTRFKNDRGFLVANTVVKDIYINHLGDIAVTEDYKVTNDGARHAGEWSRSDYSDRYSPKYGSALGDVWANLPADAVNVEYKDLIGNITSSRLRLPSKGKRAIQLIYRYPLMGGWNNHFWINYEMSLANYLRSSGSDHELTIPLFPSLNTDLLCKKLEVRVFLPEWAHSYEVLEHDSLQVIPHITSERTTLTMLGRPVLAFKLEMLRSLSKHTRTIRIKYSYEPKLAWVTPGIVAVGIFLLFAGFIMCVRTGLELVDEGDETISEMDKVKSQ